MLYKIKIPTSIVIKSINKALTQPVISRGNFFHEIRDAFKKNIEEIFISSGLKVNSDDRLGNTNYLKYGVQQQWNSDVIVKYTGWNNNIKKELDFNFCTRYGHNDYSLEAINYIDRTKISIPALSSLSDIFSIGNILILVENKDCKIELSLGKDLHSLGYSYHISKRKKKSYFCLFGIWFEPKLINSIINNKISTHIERKDELDEIRLGNISYPMLWVDRVIGNLYTCSCFNGYFNTEDDIERLLPYGNSNEGLKNRVKNINYINKLCHYCQGGIPKHQYEHNMYYSSFLQKYLPYHGLFSRIKYGKPIYKGNKYRDIENELREHFGYPKIGEGWLTETTLYKIILMLFPDFKVIYHYRGIELERLELDIWIPELKIGIEYQGEQHYKVIEHWGGKEGLEKRIENDKKKKLLCKKLNYILIEFKFSEDITEELVRKRIGKFIKRKGQ